MCDETENEEDIIQENTSLRILTPSHGREKIETSSHSPRIEKNKTSSPCVEKEERPEIEGRETEEEASARELAEATKSISDLCRGEIQSENQKYQIQRFNDSMTILMEN